MLVKSLIDVVSVGIVLTVICTVIDCIVDKRSSWIFEIGYCFQDGMIFKGIRMILALLSNIITWPFQLIYYAVTGIKKGVTKLF